MVKNKILKYGIRKFSIGAVVAVIGSGFIAENSALASVTNKNVEYKYVLENELTNEEKSLIKSTLTSNLVNENDVYYMVYRPVVSKNDNTILPNTKSYTDEAVKNELAAIMGASLLLIAYKVRKKDKKKLISSILIISILANSLQVEEVKAIENDKLKSYDTVYSLSKGSILPETVLDINGYEFVGYIELDTILDDEHKDKIESKKEITPEVLVDNLLEEKTEITITTEVPKTNLVVEEKPEITVTTEVPKTNLVVEDKPEITVTTEVPKTNLVVEEKPEITVTTEVPDTNLVVEDKPEITVTTEVPKTNLVVEEKLEITVTTEVPNTNLVVEEKTEISAEETNKVLAEAEKKRQEEETRKQEAERLEAEKKRQEEEARRQEAERLEVEKKRQEEEARRQEAERLEAEKKRQEEEARLEAERLKAEAERKRQEEIAKQEAIRLAKEQLQEEVNKEEVEKNKENYTLADSSKKEAYDNTLTLAKGMLTKQGATKEEIEQIKNQIVATRESLNGDINKQNQEVKKEEEAKLKIELEKKTKEILSNITFNSDEVARALNIIPDSDELRTDALTNNRTQEESKKKLIQKDLDKLYFEKEFEKVKTNLERHVTNLLEKEKVIDTAELNKIIDYIEENKAKIMLGITYMQRWYNINFDKTNIQDIATYQKDAVKEVNVREWLTELGGAGLEKLKVASAESTYEKYIAPNTGIATLPAYLTKNRQLYTKYTSDAEWFKNSTKAYVVEEKSKVKPDFDVSLYSRLLSSADERKGILPLLTADEGIFAISTMTTLTYGMFDRYMTMSDRENNPIKYKEELEKHKKLVDDTAKAQAGHLDFWYRVVNDDVKEKLAKVVPVPVWDGYKVGDNWLPLTGNTSQRILDFFGPIEKELNDMNLYPDGYAKQDNSLVALVNQRILDRQGWGVFTHELVHILEESVYLGGHMMRPNTKSEYYARGLLETPRIATRPIIAFNSMYDWTNESKFNKKTSHNSTSNRFNTQEELNTYINNMFDVIYTLDILEAEAAIESGQPTINKLFYKLNVSQPNAEGLVSEEKVAVTGNISTLEDFVHNNLISVDYTDKTTTGNTYVELTTNSPIFATGGGIPGDTLFRRNAFEIFAYKGYEGFIGYASDKFNVDAQREGRVLTDDYIIQKISDGKYQTMKKFKVDMLKERKNKLNNLREIAVEISPIHKITITSYNQMKELFKQYLNRNDLRGADNFKTAVYSAYLRATNEFREEIYKK